MQGVYVMIFSTVRSIPFTGQSQNLSQAVKQGEGGCGPTARNRDITNYRYAEEILTEVFIRYLMNACLHE